MSRLLAVLMITLFSPTILAGNIQQLLQLIDYVGVDYAASVQRGEVINTAEYEEMQDFSSGIGQQIALLPEAGGRDELVLQAEQLSALIAARADAGTVNQLSASMRDSIIEAYKLTVVPAKQPDLARGATLYSEHCAGCHGMSGNGRGPAAAGMQPAPTDFLDSARYAQRNLYGLYNTITRGVPATGMRPFQNLSAEDRWSLAFYVGQFAVSENTRNNGDTLLAEPQLVALLDIKKLTTTTPAEAAEAFGPAGAELAAYLRTQPASLFAERSPLQFSHQRLDAVASAYRSGNKDAAYQLAVEAYLEGFELVEQALNAVDPALGLEIEQAMTGLRTDIRKGVPGGTLDAEISGIQGQLDLAQEHLDGHSLSGATAFASAFFILVREGLEALLVVVALAAFLLKTEHRNNIRYLHYGWIGALLAGGLTWWVSVSLVEVSGISREITEGVAALMATAVLFYVGYWLQNKSHAAQWKKFIEGMVHKAMSSGTLWGLAGLSFIAVYREVFETILFYQTLWVQTDAAGRSMAISGFGSGVGVLILLAWLVLRYSARLPLRQFFSVTGILMLALAVVFAGKGVAALQEAGYIPIHAVSFPRIDVLGIYPNLQGLLLQLGLALLALLLWYGLPGKRAAAS